MSSKDAKDALSHTKDRAGKTIEQIYQKKTQLEHILLRPDTYVGSVEKQQQELWVFDSVQSRMVHRNITYVPALYKIFDEILVNAADNFMRDPENMDAIKVEINPAEGKISVWNNGKGLPVVIHKEHGVYVPEMVFGHLLTSDNYNDGDCKVVGGRNGYGAKLTNIFSTEFIVETCDGQKKFKQRFSQNMTNKSKPEVANTKEKPHTCITFKPELSRFGMEKLEPDTVSLLTKRVYDIAGSTNEKCSVWLNREKLDIHSFKDYTDLYLLTRQGLPKLFEKCGDRWEVGLSLTESGFQQVSFVNSICTVRGGTHVAQVSDQIVESIQEKVKAMSKEKCKGGLDIRPHHVRNHLWVFIRCLVENPAFDSQTKETLTTKQSKFGSRCELSEEFLEKAANCGVADLILQAAMAKSKVDLGKKLKANTGRVTRLTGVPKLEDANDAGGKNSADCTLILTEGDSAKALAVAGLSVIGRDRFGVFPLRGKVLNVRDATLKSMMDNAEIQNIIKIVGLDFNREYDAELKGLRYGSIMIMTDQDHDGSHIKGLLINLIHAWWPSLAKLKGFIKEFFTPIVKVSKGKQVVPFFTMPEYEKWKEETDNGKGWKIKYYKGLGTSTSKEAKEYFSKLESHKMAYRWDDLEDDQAIDLAFNKKRADDRKDWINGYKEGDLVDHTQSEVSYKDFINKELVLFSKANVVRAIPSIMDGFKPSQRKVLFGCFKRKLKNDVKVAQLTGYVSEHAQYHHGEAALQETIVGMAQDFVGSNNINLLVPQGQFGSRLLGGKDAASARYIYTRLSPITRYIFKEADEKVLKSQSEDGMTIEPEWYCPVIPMVLVNGCDGIGTGWSSAVPCFNPREIIANLRRVIEDKDLKEMTPWYQGFKGAISDVGRDGKCEVTGVVEVLSSSKAAITELPIRKWTQDYREFLEELLPKHGEKKNNNKILEDFRENHTEKSVNFEVVLSQDGGWRDSEATDLIKAFRLRSSIALTNMILFDSEGRVNKYESPLDIIREFSFVRLQKYQERKDYILSSLARDCEILSAKARFIKLVLQGEIKVKRRQIKALIEELRSRAFKPLREIKGPATSAQGDGEGADAEEEEEDGADEDEDAGDVAQEEEEQKAAKKAVAQGVKDYEYLVGMPISTLTREKVEELMRQRDLKIAEHDTLKKKTKEQLWLEDLKQLEAALDERDAVREQEERQGQAKIQKALRGEQAAAKRGAKRAASAGPSASASSDQASAASRKRAADTPTEQAAGGGRGRPRKV